MDSGLSGQGGSGGRKLDHPSVASVVDIQAASAFRLRSRKIVYSSDEEESFEGTQVPQPQARTLGASRNGMSLNSLDSIPRRVSSPNLRAGFPYNLFNHVQRRHSGTEIKMTKSLTDTLENIYREIRTLADIVTKQLVEQKRKTKSMINVGTSKCAAPPSKVKGKVVPKSGLIKQKDVASPVTHRANSLSVIKTTTIGNQHKTGTTLLATPKVGNSTSRFPSSSNAQGPSKRTQPVLARRSPGTTSLSHVISQVRNAGRPKQPSKTRTDSQAKAASAKPPVFSVGQMFPEVDEVLNKARLALGMAEDENFEEYLQQEGDEKEEESTSTNPSAKTPCVSAVVVEDRKLNVSVSESPIENPSAKAPCVLEAVVEDSMPNVNVSETASMLWDGIADGCDFVDADDGDSEQEEQDTAGQKGYEHQMEQEFDDKDLHDGE